MKNNSKKISKKNTPQVSGIDALYYFAQSGGGYDDYYMNIIDQIDDVATLIHT